MVKVSLCKYNDRSPSFKYGSFSVRNLWVIGRMSVKISPCLDLRSRLRVTSCGTCNMFSMFSTSRCGPVKSSLDSMLKVIGLRAIDGTPGIGISMSSVKWESRYRDLIVNDWRDVMEEAQSFRKLLWMWKSKLPRSRICSL